MTDRQESQSRPKSVAETLESKMIDGKAHYRTETGYTVRQYFSHFSDETGKPGPGWDRHFSALEEYGVDDVSELPDTPYYIWKPVTERDAE